MQYLPTKGFWLHLRVQLFGRCQQLITVPSFSKLLRRDSPKNLHTFFKDNLSIPGAEKYLVWPPSGRSLNSAIDVILLHRFELAACEISCLQVFYPLISECLLQFKPLINRVHHRLGGLEWRDRCQDRAKILPKDWQEIWRSGISILFGFHCPKSIVLD